VPSLVATPSQRPVPRRRWLFRAILCGGSLLLALGTGEVTLRVAGRYRLDSLRLEPAWATGDAVAAELAGNEESVRHVRAAAQGLAPGLADGWLAESPPPLPKHAVDPHLLASWGGPQQLMFLCEVNEVLLRSLWRPGSGLVHAVGPDHPREFRVFTPPDGQPHPLYRYPPSVTMPDGLTTNAFGFRGPEIALDKPARTVRIACVGASTTVDAHHFAWSYPELLQHWLGRWAGRAGFDVRFEVINAGREAIRSDDIRAVVSYEVLPLAVDYVVYYEGANQFGVADLLRHVRVDGPFTPGQPPPGVVLDLAGQEPRSGRWIDALCTWSATAERLRSLFESRAPQPEPRKPPQRLALPPGLDERLPDLARAAEVLQLGAVLADLDAIHAATRAANARLLLCSFCWMARDGLQLDLQAGRSVFWHLNGAYWPVTYAHVRRLADLQNRCYAAWAKDRGVPFLDVAAGMPLDPRLYTDGVHATELGSRLRAWLTFAALVPHLEADLRSGVVPVPDARPDPRHPYLLPARRLDAAELDRR